MPNAIPFGLLRTPKRRFLFSIPYSKNNPVTKYKPDFPAFLYSKLVFRLTGNVLKGGGTSFGSVVTEGPYTLIKNVNIKCGGQTVKDGPARIMRANNIINNRVDATKVTAAAANGTSPIEATIEIPFGIRNAKLRKDPQTNPNDLIGPELTYLPASRYDTLECTVLWGDELQILSGANDYNAPALSIDPTTKIDVFGEIVEDPRPVTIGSQKYLVNRQLTKAGILGTTTLVATETKLPVGESYHGLIVSQYTNTAGVIAPVTTIIPATSFVALTANNQSLAIVRDTWAGWTANNLNEFGVTLPTGMIFIPLMNHGDYLQSLRADNPNEISSLELLTDITGVANGFLDIALMTLAPGQ